MAHLSSAQAWLRDRYQRANSSDLFKALKPPQQPRRKYERFWTLAWNTMMEFRGENIALRSAALTYITLFSLVPMLAVAFAIVRAIGQEEIRQAIHEFIFTNLVPGTAQQLGSYIDTFISRASSGALGALGGFFLLVSAITLLSNIETSLNEIWGVQRRRSILQQGLIYWCVITLGPIFITISLVVTGAMRTNIERHVFIPRPLFTLVPMAATILFFAFLYIATPNAKVRTVPAMVGAVIAGVVWEIAKHAFAIYTVKSISYSAIYGSLGAIPLFLFWIYICWFIFLAGARIAFALQHAITGTPSDPRICDGRTREILYVRILLSVCGAFTIGKAPPNAKAIGEELTLDHAYVAEAARDMETAGLIAMVGDGFVPGRPPSKITVADAVNAAQSRPAQATGDGCVMSKVPAPLGKLFEDSDRQSLVQLEHMTISKLCSEITAAQQHPDAA